MRRSTLARTLGVGALAISMLAGGAGAWAQTAQPGAGPTTTTVGDTTTTTTASPTTTTVAQGGARSGMSGVTTMAARRVDRDERGGRRVYGLTTSNRLVTFSLRTPYRIRDTRRITGLARGEQVVGIDVRPANGRLYAVGSTSRVYTVDPRSGRATAVGDPFTPALDGTEFGVDFNPQADRLRVISNLGQNLRIVPDTGQVAANKGDTPLTYVKGDQFEGILPRMVAAAYTNNVPAAPSTQLYDIDTRQDTVALQSPPNDGVLKTVGELRVDTERMTGLDIYTVKGMDIAVASLTPAGSNGSNVYVVDLTTGRANLLSPVGRFGVPLRDIAVTL
jgi:hypothetical protein